MIIFFKGRGVGNYQKKNNCKNKIVQEKLCKSHANET